MEQFTIMCPSNSSMKMFPRNTAAEFTVQLPEPLNLSEEWEVGLKKIQITNSWFNIREGRNRFDMRLRMPNKEDGTRGDQLIDECYVTPGKYESIEDIFQAMKSALASKWDAYSIGKGTGSTKMVDVLNKNKDVEATLIGQGQPPQSFQGAANWYGIDLKYDNVTRRTIFDTTSKTINPETGETIQNRRSIRLTGDLATVLGFKQGAIIKSDKVTTSTYAALPIGSLFNIYIYCDAIEPQIVGGTKSKCIRILPMEAKHGDVVIAKEFNSPNYMPLIHHHHLTTISFKIADDTGENIAFDYGRTVICLHFRKRSSISTSLFSS